MASNFGNYKGFNNDSNFHEIPSGTWHISLVDNRKLNDTEIALYFDTTESFDYQEDCLKCSRHIKLVFKKMQVRCQMLLKFLTHVHHEFVWPAESENT